MRTERKCKMKTDDGQPDSGSRCHGRRSQEERGKAVKQRGSVCRVTHWVSTRGEGDGLHVMVGNYLRRKQEGERKGKTRGEHVGDVTHVGSEMKACGWKGQMRTHYRGKCFVLQAEQRHSRHWSHAGAGTTEWNILTVANNHSRWINRLGTPCASRGLLFCEWMYVHGVLRLPPLWLAVH